MALRNDFDNKPTLIDHSLYIFISHHWRSQDVSNDWKLTMEWDLKRARSPSGFFEGGFGGRPLKKNIGLMYIQRISSVLETFG